MRFYLIGANPKDRAIACLLSRQSRANGFPTERLSDQTNQLGVAASCAFRPSAKRLTEAGASFGAGEVAYWGTGAGTRCG